VTRWKTTTCTSAAARISRNGGAWSAIASRALRTLRT
jgi:hypothetical protein